MDKMKLSGIFNICDVFICDGNGADSKATSSNNDFVKSYGARGLFINIDNNLKGQGHQLKIGFYECMKEKYKGVIMVDGNNKDNISESLPTFIKKLEEGYDVVQATRYKLGGKGINTPLLREIAIRFVASPMITLGSGFKYSDPCNGYKAFSMKYITNQKMDWFGDFYKGYEYCYYPLAQAKSFGYKITEVPTAGVYPKGKVVTKITSISSHIKLLKLIFDLSFSKKLGKSNNQN